MEPELTLNDLASDPLIALLMKADGVHDAELASLLNQTARVEVERLKTRLLQANADAFYHRLDAALLLPQAERRSR
jgi:hypothetical protein